MSRKVTVSSIQLPAPDYSEDTSLEQIKKKNLEKALKWVKIAGERRSDIVCLGEIFTTLGINNDRYDYNQQAEDIPGPGSVLEELSQIARQYEMYIIAPVLGRCEGIIRNVALVIDRGGRLFGQYYKVHCTREERNKGVVPGDEFNVFNLDFGRIGIMICYDNSFPESARVLALKGAEIIFWPHIQIGWGEVAWEAILRSRAIDNGIYLVSSSYGVPDEKAWRPGMIQGRSGIVCPDGLIISEMGYRIGVATAELDLDKPRIIGDLTLPGDRDFKKDMLADRRPETYKKISEKNN
ncbi:MAG: carbon-nitrogen hydrolase family protein [Caldiserica bacterium]|nr:carbon-nitrogen hydrolase family protein [Caldisericota bacterium]